MKTLLLIFILTLSFPIALYSQTNDSNKEAKNIIITIGHKEIKADPLYVIKIADKTIEHRLKNKPFEESFLNELNPEWLESVNVLKGPEGVQKYGSRAEDGVILVLLKEDSWEKMTAELRNRFK